MTDSLPLNDELKEAAATAVELFRELPWESLQIDGVATVSVHFGSEEARLAWVDRFDLLCCASTRFVQQKLKFYLRWLRQYQKENLTSARSPSTSDPSVKLNQFESVLKDLEKSETLLPAQYQNAYEQMRILDKLRQELNEVRWNGPDKIPTTSAFQPRQHVQFDDLLGGPLMELASQLSSINPVLENLPVSVAIWDLITVHISVLTEDARHVKPLCDESVIITLEDQAQKAINQAIEEFLNFLLCLQRCDPANLQPTVIPALVADVTQLNKESVVMAPKTESSPSPESAQAPGNVTIKPAEVRVTAGCRVYVGEDEKTGAIARTILCIAALCPKGEPIDVSKFVEICYAERRENAGSLFKNRCLELEDALSQFQVEKGYGIRPWSGIHFTLDPTPQEILEYLQKHIPRRNGRKQKSDAAKTLAAQNKSSH